MATFPHSLCDIRQDGHGEQHMPMVLRSDMERGIPKQRRTGADVLVRVPCSLVFRSAADAAAFESWFYAEGGGWFDFTLPRTGSVVQARIIGGDIGSLTPLTPAWNASERSVVLEYVRPAFVTLAPGLYDVDAARILSVQRNSTATYMDDGGVLQTAPANVARYQGGQLLVEGEATNRLLQSRLIGSTSWLASNVSSVAGPASIDGAASRTLTVTSTTNPVVYQSPALSAGEWVFSVVAKAGSSSTLVLRVDSPTQTSATFNLAAGTVTGAGSIASLGSGWFLCAFPVNAAVVNAVLSIGSTVGNSVHVDMAQVESGAAATSRIHTPTTTATRAADIITVAA